MFWEEAEKIHRPKKWRTDGHRAYHKAFKKVFYSNYKDRKVEWERHSTRRTGKFNYTMERWNRNLKDRLRTIYGFKALWSAPILLHGFVIYYNFVRPHMGLKGRTPAELAGVGQNLSENKWLDLIKIASLKS